MAHHDREGKAVGPKVCQGHLGGQLLVHSRMRIKPMLDVCGNLLHLVSVLVPHAKLVCKLAWILHNTSIWATFSQVRTTMILCNSASQTALLQKRMLQAVQLRIAANCLGSLVLIITAKENKACPSISNSSTRLLQVSCK